MSPFFFNYYIKIGMRLKHADFAPNRYHHHAVMGQSFSENALT
jgi:hypothetical protein